MNLLWGLPPAWQLHLHHPLHMSISVSQILSMKLQQTCVKQTAVRMNAAALCSLKGGADTSCFKPIFLFSCPWMCCYLLSGLMNKWWEPKNDQIITAVDKKGCSRLFKVNRHRFVTFDFVLSLELDSIQPSDWFSLQKSYIWIFWRPFKALLSQGWCNRYVVQSNDQIQEKVPAWSLNGKVLSLVIKIFKWWELESCFRYAIQTFRPKTWKYDFKNLHPSILNVKFWKLEFSLTFAAVSCLKACRKISYKTTWLKFVTHVPNNEV